MKSNSVKADRGLQILEYYDNPCVQKQGPGLKLQPSGWGEVQIQDICRRQNRFRVQEVEKEEGVYKPEDAHVTKETYLLIETSLDCKLNLQLG